MPVDILVACKLSEITAGGYHWAYSVAYWLSSLKKPKYNKDCYLPHKHPLGSCV